MDSEDQKVFLRLGLILFGRGDILSQIREYIEGLEKDGKIRKLVYKKMSSEKLYLIKESDLTPALNGDVKPLQKRFNKLCQPTTPTLQ